MISRSLCAVALCFCAACAGRSGDTTTVGGRAGATTVEGATAPCREASTLVIDGSSGDALCPCDIPPEGSACCAGHPACTAMSTACNFDRCTAEGRYVAGACRESVWSLTEETCPVCPLSCADDEVCVISEGIEGEPACVPDPCADEPLSCACAAEATCAARLQVCLNESVRGRVVRCFPPPTSPGGHGTPMGGTP